MAATPIDSSSSWMLRITPCTVTTADPAGHQPFVDIPAAMHGCTCYVPGSSPLLAAPRITGRYTIHHRNQYTALYGILPSYIPLLDRCYGHSQSVVLTEGSSWCCYGLVNTEPTTVVHVRRLAHTGEPGRSSSIDNAVPSQPTVRFMPSTLPATCLWFLPLVPASGSC